MYPLNKIFATESSTIADWDQSCDPLCPPFAPLALVFTNSTTSTTTYVGIGVNTVGSYQYCRTLEGVKTLLLHSHRILIVHKRETTQNLTSCPLPPRARVGSSLCSYVWIPNVGPPLACSPCSRLQSCTASLSKPVSVSPAPEPVRVGPASQPQANTGPLGPVGPFTLDRPAFRDPVRSPPLCAASLHPLCLADQRLAALTQQSRQGPPSHTAPYHMTAPLCYPAPSRPHGPSLAACPT